MLLTPNMIETREHAGTSGHGTPIIYILSKGGLHAFFSRGADGSIVTLGTAPHRAVAQWIAEKKDPKIKWSDSFVQKNEPTEDDIQKSTLARFTKLRAALFYPQNADQIEKSEPNDSFIVYDIDEVKIGVSSREEIVEAIEKGEVSKYVVVRDLGLTTPASTLELHPAFTDVYERLKDAK